MTDAEVRRGEVYLIDLKPARGGEIRKTRPHVIVSPDELNASLRLHHRAPDHGRPSIPFSRCMPIRRQAGARGPRVDLDPADANSNVIVVAGGDIIVQLVVDGGKKGTLNEWMVLPQ